MVAMFSTLSSEATGDFERIYGKFYLGPSSPEKIENDYEKIYGERNNAYAPGAFSETALRELAGACTNHGFSVPILVDVKPLN